AAVVNGADFPDCFCAHLCVVVYVFMVGEALLLDRARLYNALAYGCTGFVFCVTGQFIKRYGCYFDVQIYTVEQGTRYLAQIALYDGAATDTFLLRMVIVAARAGVHGCYQHKTCRIIYGDLCPGYR